jgi:hypothetical protein
MYRMNLNMMNILYFLKKYSKKKRRTLIMKLNIKNEHATKSFLNLMLIVSKAMVCVTFIYFESLSWELL